jgi:hypothetical protein
MSDLIDIFHITNQSLQNSLKRRGVDYDSPEKFIADKEKKKLLIPKFTTNFGGTTKDREEIRKILFDWLYTVTACSPFSKDKISAFCLGVELFDRVLLSLKHVSIKWVQLIGIVCLWIASKLHQDDFEIYVNAQCINNYTDNAYTAKDVLLAERLILKRLDWEISSRYTIPWFVDYLGGFASEDVFDKIAKFHISGEYRLIDPYSGALKFCGK